MDRIYNPPTRYNGEGQWHNPPALHLGETFECRHHGHHLLIVEVSYFNVWITWVDGKMVGVVHNGLGGVENELIQMVDMQDSLMPHTPWDGVERRRAVRYEELNHVCE